jgi:acyl-CoA thioester hydrolase
MPVGERKSGIPLSVDTPAPVSTTHGWCSRIRRASEGASTATIVESSRVEFGFETEVKVRFAETDAQGIAHHAVYLVWFEAARVDYLARFDGGYPGLQARGVEALTTEAHARFVAPARFDEVLTVGVRCTGLRGARFRFEYHVTRDGDLIADGWTGHACVDAHTFRPTRVPEFLKEAIARAEEPAQPPTAESSS